MIRTIERAIKDLYAIHTPYRAERFLLTSPESSNHIDGALYVRPGSEIRLGIYFSPKIQSVVEDLSLHTELSTWSTNHLNTFCVLAEEVSHFHYFLYHASNGRPVSQLELEIQGEIDRFLVCHFFNPQTSLTTLVERLFERFKIRENATPEEAQRYERAHDTAKKFVLRHFSRLAHPSQHELLFRFLRRFYRLAEREKIRLVNQS